MSRDVPCICLHYTLSPSHTLILSLLSYYYPRDSYSILLVEVIFFIITGLSGLTRFPRHATFFSCFTVPVTRVLCFKLSQRKIASLEVKGQRTIPALKVRTDQSEQPRTIPALKVQTDQSEQPRNVPVNNYRTDFSRIKTSPMASSHRIEMADQCHVIIM